MIYAAITWNQTEPQNQFSQMKTNYGHGIIKRINEIILETATKNNISKQIINSLSNKVGRIEQCIK